jgi:predicted DNA-binding transcriptional regulator AlpA
MKQAVIFNPDDFQQFLSELKAIAKAELRGYVVEEPMTAKEAASFLNITEKTLWERVRKGKLPTELIHRNVGSVYFFASELHQYIKNN